MSDFALAAIGSSSLVVLVLLVLWGLNYSRDRRYHQFYYPAIALVYCVAVVGALLAFKNESLPWAFSRVIFDQAVDVQALLAALESWAQTAVATSAVETGAVVIWRVTLYGWTFFTSLLDKLNFVVLLGFLLLKLVVYCCVRLWRCLRYLIRLLLRQGHPICLNVCGVNPLDPKDTFYHYEPGQGVVLKEEWVGVHTLLLVLSWVSLAWLVASIWLEIYLFDLPFALLPAIPVILLFEGAWYLGGRISTVLRPEITGTDERVLGQDGDYASLFMSYLDKWPHHWLAFLNPPPSKDVITRQAIDHFESCLKAGADFLVPQDPHELLKDPLLKHAMRVIAQGQDLLFLLPDHGDPTKVEKWLSEWLRDRLPGLDDAIRIYWGGALGELLNNKKERDVQEQSPPGVESPEPPFEKRPPRILIALPYEIANLKDSAALRNTGLVVQTQVADALTSPLASVRALHLIKFINPKAQLVLFGEVRQNLFEAVRRNFPVAPEEMRFSRQHAEKTFVIIWRSDAVRWYQQEVFGSHASNFMGVEYVLATLAWARGAINVRLGEQQGQAWRHNLETLQNHRNYLRLHGVLDEDLMGMIRDLAPEPVDPWFFSREERSVLLVQDALHNLPATIDKWSCKARQSVLLHVVSPPYLLRDYFAANADYFFHTPALPLAPKMDQGYPVAWTLAAQLQQEEDVAEDDLRRILARLPTEEGQGILQRISSLLKDFVTDGKEAKFKVDTEYQLVEDRFELKQRVRLEPGSLAVASFFQVWRLVDEDGQILESIQEAHLYQRYLPGQMHAFAGAVYRVRRFEQQAKRIVLEKAAPRGAPLYRPIIDFTLHLVGQVHESPERRGICKLTLTPIETRIEVRTRGYYRFMGSIVRRASEGAEYYGLKGKVPERVLKRPAVWRFQFSPEDGKGPEDVWGSQNAGEVSKTLALLLNEMIPTLFPGNETLLYVLAPGMKVIDNDSLFRFGFEFAPLASASLAPTAAESPTRSAGQEVVFYVIEDSPIHMGLAQAFMEEWTVIFALLYDYLCWVLDEEGKGTAGVATEGQVSVNPDSPSPIEHGMRPSIPADEGAHGPDDSHLTVNPSPARGEGDRHGAKRDKPFLGYGADQPTSDLALKETRALLEALNFGLEHTRDSHRAQRKRFLEQRAGQTQAGPGAVPPHQTERCCSFCCQDARIDYLELPNGRIRCGRCDLTALKTAAEMEQRAGETFQLFKRTFRVDLRQVNIEFWRGFDLSDGPDGAAGDCLPCSYHQGTGLYSRMVAEGADVRIRVATGLPLALCTAELARQFALVWIHDYVDLDAMREEFSLEDVCRLIEGVVDWAIRQLVEAAGLWPEYRRLNQAAEGRKDGSGNKPVDKKNGLELIRGLLAGETEAPFQRIRRQLGDADPAEGFALLLDHWPIVRGIRLRNESGEDREERAPM